MCLNLSFEVKNQLTFYNVRWFKNSFCNQVYSMLQEFWGSANILLRISLKMGKNEEHFEFDIFFEAKKYYFYIWFKAYFFFQMVIFATLIRRCPTLSKSTLKMTTLFRRCLTLFHSTLKCKTLFQRCWTL